MCQPGTIPRVAVQNCTEASDDVLSFLCPVCNASGPNLYWAGPDHLTQTENDREGKRRLMMALAETMLDKLNSFNNSKRTKRRNGIRPGPTKLKTNENLLLHVATGNGYRLQLQSQCYSLVEPTAHDGRLRHTLRCQPGAPGVICRSWCFRLSTKNMAISAQYARLCALCSAVGFGTHVKNEGSSSFDFSGPKIRRKWPPIFRNNVLAYKFCMRRPPTSGARGVMLIPSMMVRLV